MKLTAIVWFILLAIPALYLRLFRLTESLGFFYDQGRDALAIWQLWHTGKLFLIGPTTGIEGIFLGPAYYYLIAPFYLLYGGHPVGPALFLIVLNLGAMAIGFSLTRRWFNLPTAILGTFFTAFSYYSVQAHRWLSNPTPLPFTAALSLWAIDRIATGKSALWWVILGLSLGLSLQFEAASAIFFLPATLIILVILHPDRFRFTGWGRGLIAFLLTLLPQIIFDLRHQHLLFRSFVSFLTVNQSFRVADPVFLPQRLALYFEIFSRRFILDSQLAPIAGLFLLIIFIAAIKKLPRKPFSILAVWWLTPLIALLFYHGNHGYIWDYYFTGIYAPFAILIASVIVYASFRRWSLIFSGLFCLWFLTTNIPPLRNWITHLPDPQSLTLGPAIRAVDWIYADAAGRPFNVDVYVPPVIPYAYDYLFLWRGSTRFHTLPDFKLVPLLYTLSEPDTEHPDLLQAWTTRQQQIAVPDFTAKFNGLTVSRRYRVNKL